MNLIGKINANDCMLSYKVGTESLAKQSKNKFLQNLETKELEYSLLGSRKGNLLKLTKVSMNQYVFLQELLKAYLNELKDENLTELDFSAKKKPAKSFKKIDFYEKSKKLRLRNNGMCWDRNPKNIIDGDILNGLFSEDDALLKKIYNQITFVNKPS